jgi:hypothetical protein
MRTGETGDHPNLKSDVVYEEMKEPGSEIDPGCRPETYPTPNCREVKLCHIKIIKTRILIFLAIFVLTTTSGFSGGWHGNGNWHGYPNRGGVYFGDHRYAAGYYKWSGGWRYYNGYSYPWWLMPFPIPLPVPYGYGY